MWWVTEAARIQCGHDGWVRNHAQQQWVTIGGTPVLVDSDPEGRPVLGCPNVGATIKPCSTTLRVITGYSPWLTIDGHRIVMSNLDGITDGTVPGTVHYTVRNAGQALVEADQ